MRTLYSQDGYELAKTVIMIFSTKKIQALTDSDVTKIKTMQTLLTTVLRVQILAEISTVQTAITDSGSTLETTEADITKFTFPLTEETQESETSLTEVERLTIVLKALLANKNGLETAITAISTALSSTSSSGASGAKVKILISMFSRKYFNIFSRSSSSSTLCPPCQSRCTDQTWRRRSFSPWLWTWSRSPSSRPASSSPPQRR